MLATILDLLKPSGSHAVFLHCILTKKIAYDSININKYQCQCTTETHNIIMTHQPITTTRNQPVVCFYIPIYFTHAKQTNKRTNERTLQLNDDLLTVPLVTSMGQYRHQPSARSYFSDNSPFLDIDDDDDDYSAYFPSAAGSRQQQAAANLFRQQQQNQLLQSASSLSSPSSLLSSSSTKPFKSMRPTRY